MEPLQSVTILGGGVVGCFLAYRLVHAGVPVTVIERERVGAGASGVSAGNVQPGDVEVPLAAESLGLYRHFLPILKEETGVDPLDHEVQYFYAALDDHGVAQTQRFAAALRQDGLRVEWIDGHAARDLEPRLAPNVLGGALHQDCLQMDAARFVSALSQAAQRHRGQLRYGEVVGLQRARDRVSAVVLKDGSTLACDTLVVALGGWTGAAVSTWLGASLPVAPHSLQKLHVRPVDLAPRCAVHWDGVNIVARRDGLVHVGSKHDDTGFAAQPTPEGRHWLLERLQTVLPGFKAQVAEALAGLASSTPAKVPLLGALPGFDNVYVAAPSTNGFLLSAVLAHILTDLLVHGKHHPLLSRLSPAQAQARAAGR